MAKKASTIKNEKNKGKNTKSKASKAAQVDKDQLRIDERNRLLIRLLSGILLVFLAMFLLLSMVGIEAALLNIFRVLVQGLFGYGFWVMPIGMVLIAWLLIFRHDEPIVLRTIAISLFVVLFSSLLHVILCSENFATGFGLVKELWAYGVDGLSGGVISGLVAEGLVFCVSKGGAVPILIVLLVVLVFVIFRISAAMILHKKAEKRREKLEQLRQERQQVQPVLTRQDTIDDLKVMGTPAPIRIKMPEKQRTAKIDIPLDENEEAPKKKRIPAVSVELDEEYDDDLIFLKKKKKQTKQEEVPVKQQKKRSPFDIPLDEETTEVFTREDLHMEPEEEPYAPNVEEFLAEELAENAKAVEASTILTDAEVAEAVEEAKKNQKVSSDEAAVAAAEVAKEIEMRGDAEAQVKPVYQYPPMTMLTEALSSKEDNTEEMRANVRKLESTLKSFGVDITIENVVRGPAITRYEMELQPGVKLSKITSLNDDIALALGVSGVRVSAIVGKSGVIGIEVPNKIVTSVPIREVLMSNEFKNHKSNLAFAAGKDIGGNYIVGDIAKMPHLLIAGTTGSGKSVCMNSIIVSLLYRASPEQVRVIMIDPKVVELSVYNGIPHLLIPVVTDPKKAAGALQWAVTEMERRYRLLAEFKVRDLSGYNKLAKSKPDMEPMPQIVVIIDELADLMLVAAKEVENSIVRIAQKARAAGIHLVIATQRPSADVITGVMKSNIPSRIAFAVASAIDSRIILDDTGAEKLVGKGDMLFAPLGQTKHRVQGCFITDEEVEEIVEFVKNSSESDYSDEILREIEQNAASGTKEEAPAEQSNLSGVGDELLPAAVEVILDTKQASVSMLQRRLKLGYAHAARIVDEMEEKGIVGPFEGSKPRQLLITREQWDAMVGINPNAKAPAETAPADDEDDVPFDEDE